MVQPDNVQVLVEQSLLGWKEYELEVMRDMKDNVVIICSIENVDPMGVHTGDSITIAPAQTLTDKEYQRLRDAAVAIIREMGVETGTVFASFRDCACSPAFPKKIVLTSNGPQKCHCRQIAVLKTALSVQWKCLYTGCPYIKKTLLIEVTLLLLDWPVPCA